MYVSVCVFVAVPTYYHNIDDKIGILHFLLDQSGIQGDPKKVSSDKWFQDVNIRYFNFVNFLWQLI